MSRLLKHFKPGELNMIYEVKKEQVGPFLDKYLEYMMNDKIVISGEMRRELINFQTYLLVESKPADFKVTLIRHDLDALSEKEKLEFLQDFITNTNEKLCSDQCNDRLRNMELFMLTVISDIPDELYEEWLIPTN